MRKINESFKCVNCWKIIPPARKTCRDHCPYCFVSIHLDKDIPGDRKSDCKWLMYPIFYEISNSQIKITFKCSKCGALHRNKAAEDDDIWNLDFFINKYKWLV